MLGAIASGETTIEGLLLGEDPRSTASCFREMGAEISELNTEKVVVQGVGLNNLSEPSDVLNAGNSGTTLRLMLGLLAASGGRFFTVTGGPISARSSHVSGSQTFATNGCFYLGERKQFSRSLSN